MFKSLTTPTSIDWWFDVNICFRQLWVISCHGGYMGALRVEPMVLCVCRVAVNLVVFDRPCLQTPNLCFTTLAYCYKLGSKPEPKLAQSHRLSADSSTQPELYFELDTWNLTTFRNHNTQIAVNIWARLPAQVCVCLWEFCFSSAQHRMFLPSVLPT